MSFDNLEVLRGEFSMEDPWLIPSAAHVARLRRSSDGGAPRLSTTVSAYYDSVYLNVVFSAADDLEVATLLGRDDPLYDEDVVEIFLAPQNRIDYFEVEVSPIGSVFDARIHSPGGERATMEADWSWDCRGVVPAVRKIAQTGGVTSLDIVVRVPFAALGCSMPASGETWFGNFFRIDRHPQEGDEYSAWRPTLRDPPDFHVPAAFGRLRFA